MALTIAKGYIQDPNNPNAVIKADSTAMPGSVASFTQPTTLNSSNTTPTTAISLTQKPDNTNYTGILAGAQQQALSIQQQIAQMNPPKTETLQKDTSIQDYINSITAVQKPSATQTYQSGYDASGLAQQQSDLAGKAAITTEAQGRLNNISAQLTALNTEAQAIPIRDQQDATGRGITAAGLATKTADELRTNALKALPLQAQAAVIQAEVATAQGNQKLAQDLYTQASDHFDKMFTLQMQDAQNKYEFQTNLIDKVYAFADKQETRQLDALKTQQAQDFQVQQDNIKYQRQVELDKINNQQAVALANIKNQPNGVNPTTGQPEVQPQSAYQVAGNQRIITSVDELIPQISNSTAGLGGKVSGLIPGTAAYNFNSQLQTLKANIAFGALTQMREASKTGGALGQISDAEERLLSATLGSLDPGQSPEVLKAQLQKIKDSITRWNNAASGQTQTNTSVKIGGQDVPVGSIIENSSGQRARVNPDGTVTPL